MDSPRLFKLKAKRRKLVEHELKFYIFPPSEYFIFNDQGKKIEIKEKKYVIKKESFWFKFRKKYLPNASLPANRCAFFEQVLLALLVAIFMPFGKAGLFCLLYSIKGFAYFFGLRMEKCDENGLYFSDYKWNPRKKRYNRFAPWEIAAFLTIIATILYASISNMSLLPLIGGIAFLVAGIAGIIFVSRKIWPFIKLAYFYFKDKKNGICPLVEYQD
jgi:hypothetical protein